VNVLITGISKGLGHALAREYAQKGDTVLGISRGVPIGLPQQIRHKVADVTRDDTVDTVRSMLEGVPCLDLLINNAGCGSRGYKADEVEVAELSYQIELHCIGAFRVTQAALPKLHQSSNPKIINLTSRIASISQHLAGTFTGRTFSYPYRIAKCAQNMLTVCLAGDPSLEGITVAAINPGTLRTDSGSTDAEYSAEEAAQNIALLIQKITDFGIYHAFSEKAYF